MTLRPVELLAPTRFAVAPVSMRTPTLVLPSTVEPSAASPTTLPSTTLLVAPSPSMAMPVPLPETTLPRPDPPMTFALEFFTQIPREAVWVGGALVRLGPTTHFTTVLLGELAGALPTSSMPKLAKLVTTSPLTVLPPPPPTTSAPSSVLPPSIRTCPWGVWVVPSMKTGLVICGRSLSRKIVGTADAGMGKVMVSRPGLVVSSMACVRASRRVPGPASAALVTEKDFARTGTGKVNATAKAMSDGTRGRMGGWPPGGATRQWDGTARRAEAQERRAGRAVAGRLAGPRAGASELRAAGAAAGATGADPHSQAARARSGGARPAHSQALGEREPEARLDP